MHGDWNVRREYLKAFKPAAASIPRISTPHRRIVQKMAAAKNVPIEPLGLVLLADHALPEFQAARPACRRRIRRSLTVQYTKRKYQGWFGSSLGSGRSHADDGRGLHGAARARLQSGHHRFSR